MASKRKFFHLLDREPAGAEGLLVGFGFGGRVVRGVRGVDHPDSGTARARGMLDTQNTIQNDRNAGFLLSFANRRSDQRLARFDPAGWEIPQLAMLFLMNEQKSRSQPNDHQHEIPSGYRLARHLAIIDQRSFF